MGDRPLQPSAQFRHGWDQQENIHTFTHTYTRKIRIDFFLHRRRFFPLFLGAGLGLGPYFGLLAKYPADKGGLCSGGTRQVPPRVSVGQGT